MVMTAYGVKKRRHEPGPNFRLAVNKPEAQGSTSLIFQKAQILAFLLARSSGLRVIWTGSGSLRLDTQSSSSASA